MKSWVQAQQTICLCSLFSLPPDGSAELAEVEAEVRLLREEEAEKVAPWIAGPAHHSLVNVPASSNPPPSPYRFRCLYHHTLMLFLDSHSYGGGDALQEQMERQETKEGPSYPFFLTE